MSGKIINHIKRKSHRVVTMVSMVNMVSMVTSCDQSTGKNKLTCAETGWTMVNTAAWLQPTVDLQRITGLGEGGGGWGRVGEGGVDFSLIPCRPEEGIQRRPPRALSWPARIPAKAAIKPGPF